MVANELGYDWCVTVESATSLPIDQTSGQTMGFFETLRSATSSFGENREDLAEFFAGAGFGVMFLCWFAWTLKLVLMG